MAEQSLRAQLTERRTYIRPTNDAGTKFESKKAAVNRQIEHQAYLWTQAKEAQFDYLMQQATTADAAEDFKLAASLEEQFVAKTALTVSELDELLELRALIENRKASLSGRVKWMSGTSVIRDRPASAFNCSYSDVAIPADLVDIFWLLLQGCGVGFKPKPGMLTGFGQQMEVVVIPSVRKKKGGAEHTVETFDGETWTIKFGDSAKGWAKAIGKLTAHKFRATKLILDFSELRPAGLRLKGYGWISSGWEPFAAGMKLICEVLNKRIGQYLSAIDIGDIVNALGTVLSSRRSAQIWLMEDHDDELSEFIHAKDRDEKGNVLAGNHRNQSNNSIAFNAKPTKPHLRDLLNNVLNGGEPGLYNLQAARVGAPWVQGTNPCLTADTLVPVQGLGLARIGNLASTTQIVRDADGNSVPALFRKTAENAPLVEVEFSDGSRYRVTPVHRFMIENDTGRHLIEAQNLRAGESVQVADIEGRFGSVHAAHDAYLDAWMMADGTATAKGSTLFLYEPKYKNRAELEAHGLVFSDEHASSRRVAASTKRSMPSKAEVPGYVLGGNRETVMAFVRGYMQSDGHIGLTAKGWCIQVTCEHRSLLQDLQALLRLFGVKSKIGLGHAAGLKTMPDGRGGEAAYNCKDSWRLAVSNPAKFFEAFDPEKNKRGAYIKAETITVAGVTSLFEAFDPEKNKRGAYIKAETITVASVTSLAEREDVYCCTVPTTSSFDLPNVHSGNCGEIRLPSKGFCNLVQVVWHRFDGNFPALCRAHYIMARANYRQTLVDMRDGVLQLQWNDNNKLLRLCGVSPTGIVGSEIEFDEDKQSILREASIEAANAMADEIGQNRPALVTQIQPAGTSSKVLGEIGDEVQEGAHMSPTRFLFNNVNFSVHDPIVEQAREAGYDVMPNPYDITGSLVAMPVAYPASSRYEQRTIANGETIEVSTESALDQLNRYARLMKNYVQHNCSITISFSKDEITEIVDWLYENWDSYIGVSFMQRNDPTKTAEEIGFAYLPQEAVSQERHDSYVARLRPIDLSHDRGRDGVALEECATGACPIK